MEKDKMQGNKWNIRFDALLTNTKFPTRIPQSTIINVARNVKINLEKKKHKQNQ